MRTESACAYLDPRTGRTWPLDAPRWRGDGQAPLLLTPLPGIARDAIRREVRSLWRYAAALPFAPEEPISMGEGCTPLLPRRIAGAAALLKCEWLMPTGSFKDRGASVMLSLLRAQGVSQVLEDSSGNGGAAIAAYAAAGGMRAKILVPASTSPAKTVQARASGAEIELVPGSRQDCAEEALRQAERIFYASHNWHPFFLHGTKTLAYELWEELGFRAPDNVVVPCGVPLAATLAKWRTDGTLQTSPPAIAACLIIRRRSAPAPGSSSEAIKPSLVAPVHRRWTLATRASSVTK